MPFFSWLQCNPSAKLKTAKSHPLSTGNRCRPRVELLEDRAVPAILNVTTVADMIDPTDDVLSLREAVLQANGSNGADTINLPAGVYALANGPLELTSHLSIQGAGLGRTMVDGLGISDHAGASGIFDVLKDAHIAISGMTIQNGSGPAGAVYNAGDLSVDACVFSGNTGSWLSGGIYNTGLLTLNACTFSENSVPNLSLGGGAIANSDGGRISLSACTFSANTAGYHGGAISNYLATVTIRDSNFVNNSAINGFGGAIINSGDISIANSAFTNNRSEFQWGGAVYNAGQLTVRRCTLSNNFAYQAGGAIAIDPQTSATVTIADSTLSGNSARTQGGAITVSSPYYGTDLAGSLTITNCKLTSNSAPSGGAIFNTRNAYAVIVHGCDFSDNTAVDPNGNMGGGIYNAGLLTIRECTFTGNHGGLGGAVYNDAGTCSIIKSTITNNVAGGFWGGGNGGGIANFGTLTIRDSVVLGNFATLGDDLYNATLLFAYDSIIGDRYDV